MVRNVEAVPRWRERLAGNPSPVFTKDTAQ